MLNLAWTEILLIIVVAVVVIGPSQLPGAIRGIADGIKKARRQFAAFQQQADELVREAKLEGVRDQIADVKGAINEIRSFDLKGHIQKAVDEDGTLTRTFNEDPMASSGGTTTTAPARRAGDDPAADHGPLQAAARAAQARGAGLPSALHAGAAELRPARACGNPGAGGKPSAGPGKPGADRG